MINENMTDEQKYKIIFDWIVNNCKYDYAILDEVKAADYATKAFSAYRSQIREVVKTIDNYGNMSDIERAIKIISKLSGEDKYSELIELKKKELEYRQKADNFKNGARRYRKGEVLVSRYGVCEDFANTYKEICDRLGLKCERIDGHILSDGIECGHAWNAIVIGDEVKYVDISGAIHSKDGTYTETEPDDFFGVDDRQLDKMDNGKNRTITEESKEKILNLKRRMNPFNPNGAKTQVSTEIKLKIDKEDEVSLD